MTRKGSFKPSKKRVFVNTGNCLWCPFCDWHASDSMASRRRMGVHLANYHYEELAFPVGEEPEIEDA
jgi:hypothetical protein